jgi:uncharacterized protein (TIRG00374 family)
LVLIGLTVLAYAADAAIFYYLAKAARIDLSFLEAYLSQLLSALTYLIPAAPGYVGSAEASGLLVFSGILGIEVTQASILTVLFHIIMALWIVSFGIISLYFLKINPSSIFKSKKI